MENWFWIVIIAEIAQDLTFLAFDLNCLFQEHMFTFFPRNIILCVSESALQVMDLWPERGDTRHTQLWIHVRDHSSGLAIHSSPRERSLNINTASILHTNICSQPTQFMRYWPFQLRASVYLSLMAHGIYEKRPHKSQMLGDLLSCNSRPWQDLAEI